MSCFSYKQFCSLIGTDKVTDTGESFYNENALKQELDKPVSYTLVSKYFPDIVEDVMHAAEYINNDKLSLAYMNFLRVSYYELSEEHKPYLLAEEGNITKNFAPVFALLSYADKLEDEIARLKIDAVIAEKMRNVFQYLLIQHKKTFGYYGLTPIIFEWFKHYLKPGIFPIGELEFEVSEFPDEMAFFKNKESGSLFALMKTEENDKCFRGYIPLRGGEPGDFISLLKSEYERVICPGDDVINVHIPSGAKIDKENCDIAYNKAIKTLEKIFPGKKFKAFCCWSWLMDPELKEILNEKSNILSFQSYYEKIPVNSTGQEVFVFVHPKPFEQYEELPENTSLEKALKNRYLKNLPIYAHLGVHII